MTLRFMLTSKSILSLDPYRIQWCFFFNLKTSRSRSVSLMSSNQLNSRIKMLIDLKKYEKALSLYNENYEMSTDFTVNMAMKACTKLRDYQRGLSIIQTLSPTSLEDTHIQTSLIHFYMHFGKVNDACRLFSNIKKKTNPMYATMFKGFLMNNVSEKLFDLYDQMDIEIQPITFTVLFNACAQFSSDRAKSIGRKLIEKCLNSQHNDNGVFNSAIHMLMRFGDVEVAEDIFNSIKQKDIYSYGTMLKGYVDNDLPEKALALYKKMSLKPNEIIYTLVLNSCSQLGNERSKMIGRKLADEIEYSYRDNHILLTAAIHMLLKFGDINHAERIFQQIRKRDIICYNTMMKGYNDNEMFEKSLDLFERHGFELNETSYAILFKSCANSSNERGKEIGHKLWKNVPSTYRENIMVVNSALYMLMKFGNIDDAELIFKITKRKDIITYNVMLKGYNDNGLFEKALDLVETNDKDLNDISFTVLFNSCTELSNVRSKLIGEKLLNRLPNVHQCDSVLVNSVLRMLMKFNDVNHAKSIFDLIERKDIECYNTMMKGYNDNGMFEASLDLFENIEKDLNEMSYVILFKSCSELCNDRSKAIGNQLWKQMPDTYHKNTVVLNSALHMLMKFGDVNAGESIFECIPNKDIVCYNSLMKGYNENEMFEKSLDLYERIARDLDERSYAILFNSCAELCNDRAKAIGKNLLLQMPNTFRNNVVIVSTALHMLMKFGDVPNAERLFEASRDKNPIIYGAMMNGYNMNHEPLKCLGLFSDLKRLNLIPNEIHFNMVIGACAQIGILSKCESIVNEIPPHIRSKRLIQNSLITMWVNITDKRFPDNLREIGIDN